MDNVATPRVGAGDDTGAGVDTLSDCKEEITHASIAGEDIEACVAGCWSGGGTAL